MTVKVDTRQFERKLDNFAKEQIPFVVAKTLTDVAFKARGDAADKLDDTFDRPKPFTKKAFAVRKANKRDRPIEAAVFVLPAQEKYLAITAEGGRIKRGDPGSIAGGMLSPVNVRLNKYGNFPTGPQRWMAKNLAKGNIFLRELPDGRAAIFRRRKTSLNLLASIDDTRQVEPLFNMLKHVEPTVDSNLQQVFSNNFAKFVK